MLLLPLEVSTPWQILDLLPDLLSLSLAILVVFFFVYLVYIVHMGESLLCFRITLISKSSFFSRTKDRTVIRMA